MFSEAEYGMKWSIKHNEQGLTKCGNLQNIN